MIRPAIETKQVKTPDTGITVTLKTKLNYGDRKTISNLLLGDIQIDIDGADKNDPKGSIGLQKIDAVRAQEVSHLTILRSMVAWDVTEEDGSLIPITSENIEEILTEDDATFLSNSIEPDTETKKKSVNN